MGRARIATAVAVLAVASVAACASSPEPAAGDVLVRLDPVPYVLEVPASLGERLSTRPLQDEAFAAQAQADGALGAVELVFAADDGTAITFLVAYGFSDDDYDRLQVPDAPPPYGDEIARRDGIVLSVAGPFDMPFDPTTPDAQAWSSLFPITRDSSAYRLEG